MVEEVNLNYLLNEDVIKNCPECGENDVIWYAESMDIKYPFLTIEQEMGLRRKEFQIAGYTCTKCGHSFNVE